MNIVDTNKKKQEALLRLNQLEEKFHIDPIVKECFNNNELYFSDNTGKLRKLDSKPLFQKIVKDFEKKKDVVVYHCLYSETIYGNLLSLLYVSNYEEDWETERVEQDYIFSYVENLGNPNNSEYGDIFITSKDGGLVRTDV